MSELIIASIAIWVIFYVITAGFSYRYWQGKYWLIAEIEKGDDMKFALLFSLGGPIAFIVAVIGSDLQLFSYGFGPYKWGKKHELI